MRHVLMALALVTTAPAFAAPALVADRDCALIASVRAEEMHHDVRVLGRVNVNTAEREQLAQISALEPTDVEAILEARARGPITSLAAFNLSDEALDRLSVTGSSTLRRIRQLPLEVFVTSPSSASTN